MKQKDLQDAKPVLTDADRFERLLHRKFVHERPAETEESSAASSDAGRSDKQVYTKADRGATLDDFIRMIRKIVTKTMKKERVEFLPDDGSRILLDPSVKIDHPYIYYNLISRKPRKMEPKPKFRENIEDRNPDGTIARSGAIYAQVFDSEIQFNIVASDYSTANRVMNDFEDAMLIYSGYFKRNGVSELFFNRQYTDGNLDIYRQNMSIRSLVYRVSIERIWLVYDTTIAEIDRDLSQDE